MQAFYFDSVDSTNDTAKRLLREGRITGNAFIVAREQTAGRGSRGRTWHSPKDAGIYLTVIEIPSDAPAHPPTTAFTLAAGVACVEAIREVAGVAVQLKPINDLYIGGRKLGGILTEAVVQGPRVEALMIGVGLNIRKTDDDTFHHVPNAVALEEVSPAAATLNFNVLITALIRRLRLWTEVVWQGRLDEVRLAFASYCIPGSTIPVFPATSGDRAMESTPADS